MWQIRILNSKIKTAFPLINAILFDLQEGKIFENSICKNLFFIIHKTGFSYLTKNDCTDYADVFNFFVFSDFIPEYFHIYDAPLQLIRFCEEKKEKVNIRLRKRIQLKFENSISAPDKILIPENYTVQKIDENNFDKMSVFNLELEKKYWRSKYDFTKNGFGFCVFDKNNLPVSVCYAACVVDNIAEIDVTTLSEYRNKGMAKLAVNEFVKHCLKNNIVANWDCFEDNLGSLKTAESIGFKRVNEYNFLSIFKKGKKHETQ